MLILKPLPPPCLWKNCLAGNQSLVPKKVRNHWLQRLERGPRKDFPGNTVVKTLPFNAGGVGSIPGWGTKIPCVTRHGQIFFFFFFFKVPIKLIDRSCHWGGVCKPSTHTFPRPHPCVFPAVGSSVPASLCCSSFPPAFLPLLSERYWLHPHPTEIPSFFQRPTTSFYRHSHIQDKTPPIWGSCSTCYT